MNLAFNFFLQSNRKVELIAGLAGTILTPAILTAKEHNFQVFGRTTALKKNIR